jgi:membrane-associated phospholipid phosphatase
MLTGSPSKRVSQLKETAQINCFGRPSSFCFLSRSRTLRLSFGLLATSLVIGIEFSRLYLGAHYFSDVIAGYLAATFWLVLCVAVNQERTSHLSPEAEKKLE